MRIALLSLLAIVIAVTPSTATPILTGALTMVAPPASTTNDDTTATDATGIVFAEKQKYTLLANLTVDVIAPGTYDEPGDIPAGPLSIPAGSVINSWYVVFDPTSAGTHILDGTLTFPGGEQILGLIFIQSNMVPSDTTVGLAPGTSYPPPDPASGRGFDLGKFAGDIITLHGGSLVVDLHSYIDHPTAQVDHIRIITAIPEPGSVYLMLGGALVFAGLYRRKFGRR
jgi:hypothetical protein